MLDRATPQDATPDEGETRPVAFRGAGFTPRAMVESPIAKPTMTPATVPRIHPVPIRIIETDR